MLEIDLRCAVKEKLTVIISHSSPFLCVYMQGKYLTSVLLANFWYTALTIFLMVFFFNLFYVKHEMLKIKLCDTLFLQAYCDSASLAVTNN